MPQYKISILGSGNMGRSLGVRFAHLGHSVFFGGRTPSEAPARAAKLAGHDAEYGTLDDACKSGEILLWTLRERDPSKILSKDVYDNALKEKVVIDLNNRDYAKDVVGEESKWFEVSLGEELQTNLPQASVVIAFNTIPMEVLDTSAEVLRQAQAQVFAAGGTEQARHAVKDLASGIGFECVDLGGGKPAMRIAQALGDAVRFVMIDGKMGWTANIGVRLLPEPDLGIIGERETSSLYGS